MTRYLPVWGLSHLGLQRDLRPAARRLRRARRARMMRRLLFQSLGLAFCFVVIGIALPAVATPALYACGLILVGGLARAWILTRYLDYDYKEAARVIEAAHPELKQSLVTAVHVNLSGPLDFLAQRATSIALTHPSRQFWREAGRSQARSQTLAALIPIAGSVALFSLAFLSAHWAVAPTENPLTPLASDSAIEVLPGNASIERGSSLVVTARFGGPLPPEARLAILSDNGDTRTEPMIQSLADPVFAFTLRQIEMGMRYRIQHEGAMSEEYRIDVYELPALLQADALLTFPPYTGWTEREVKDTRRIGAIEGTRIQYTFTANKPLAEATLVEQDGSAVALRPIDEANTQFVLEAELHASARYRLHLTDFDGRRNPFPEDVRIEVHANQRPAFRIEHPKGDQRLSPLEEFALMAQASDDFALLDYGVAFAIGAEPPNYRSLSALGNAGATDASLQHAIQLESYNLEPDDLVNWYFWADDYDATGEPRRTRSDLFFAEIRPLDEIYREQDGGGSSGPQEGGQAEEIIDQQRRISISLFKLRHTATQAGQSLEDLEVIQRAQSSLRARLSDMAPMLEDPQARQNADDALKHMEDVIGELDTALKEPSLEPLDPSWTSSQSAYQALLRLNANEYAVSRSQNQGGGGEGPSRQSGQLDELEFRQEENRYQRATQAQPPPSAQEQQDLQLLARLNELSRRQQDLNERLREAQSAMAAAKTEEERERIRRELRRLEEEQRRMLADIDEAIQQSGQGTRGQETRQQLEQARESMRQAAEQMAQDEVSQALSSGARASQGIDRSREEARQRSASQFSDAMRQARREARRIEESHQELTAELEGSLSNRQRRLDGSDQRSELTERMDTLQRDLESLLDTLRQVTEDSEGGEPGLHRRLYDLMRQQQTNRTSERIGIGSELARQGLTEQSALVQEEVARDLQALSAGVERAAESILGSETASLRYAQSELESLTDALHAERPSPSQSDPASSPDDESAGDPQDLAQGSAPSPAHDGNQTSATGDPDGASESRRPSNEQGRSRRGGGSGGLGDLGSLIQQSMNELAENQSAPLSGGGFANWTERLQTIESLMEADETRQRLAQAREAAEAMRRDFARHSRLPQWEMVESDILNPLNDVRSWIRQELIRAEDPDTLQAIDRDPVPQEYSEAVRRYYEALSEAP